MSDYKQCTTNLMDILMTEQENPEVGYVQAPNGLYYGITDKSIPYMGYLDQLRYWVQQDEDMSILVTPGHIAGEDMISEWFGRDMTTTYKFMASLQFIVSHIFHDIVPNKEFELVAGGNGPWEVAFVNGGGNPDGPIPPPAMCN